MMEEAVYHCIARVSAPHRFCTTAILERITEEGIRLDSIESRDIVLLRALLVCVVASLHVITGIIYTAPQSWTNREAGRAGNSSSAFPAPPPVSPIKPLTSLLRNHRVPSSSPAASSAFRQECIMCSHSPLATEQVADVWKVPPHWPTAVVDAGRIWSGAVRLGCLPSRSCAS